MKTNPLKDGILIEHSTGVGTITRGMVRKRGEELSIADGRTAQETSKSDWDQALRELTGGSAIEPTQVLLESVPESERWDPVPGSNGHKREVSASEDEDEEGRSDSERLLEQGISEAHHDLMLESAKAQREEDEK